MMHETNLMEISELRAIAARIVRDQETSPDVVQMASGAIQARCQAAEEFGLAPADVVKAVLQPVFERRKGCDCSTCQYRQSELEEEKYQHALLQTHQLSESV